MKKSSLQYLRMHTNMESVIDELAPNFLGEGYINGKEDRMPYNLFVEAVEQAPMAISITDKKATYFTLMKRFPRLPVTNRRIFWAKTNRNYPTNRHLALFTTICGIPLAARKYGAGHCVIGTNSVIAISLI